MEPPPSAEERMRQLESLKKDQETTAQNIAMLEEQKCEDVKALQGLVDSRAALENDLERTRAQHAASVPRVAHSISLYATISGIRWDYSKENLVAGVVSTQKEVREFELDPQNTSRFDITQRLWEMIDNPNR